MQKEVYQLTPAQHEAAASLLEEIGKTWVGQTVITRRESDGVYYPGMYILVRITDKPQGILYCKAVVKEQLARQCYQVQWAEGTEQTQTIQHMFGPPTVRRSLQPGDHVIALAMPGETRCNHAVAQILFYIGIGACLPGTVVGTGTKYAVEVKFSDGERYYILTGVQHVLISILQADGSERAVFLDKPSILFVCCGTHQYITVQQPVVYTLCHTNVTELSSKSLFTFAHPFLAIFSLSALPMTSAHKGQV